MRVFKIKVARHRGREINVTRYVKTAKGVDIEITHTVPTAAGKQLQWVQTVEENGSFYRDCKLRNYVDPFGKTGPLHTVSLPDVPGTCKADDLLPFYYTDAEIKAGHGVKFSDGPSEGPPKTGRTWINFVTALCEVTGAEVLHLVAITWGFDRLADGTVKENGIHIPTTERMKVHGQTLKKMYPTYKFL